ncbi:hypothetical protein CALVIDRAFT_163306 [Calocera viscosa TUFC12733]|uniref:Uncharacterized protein n=1 Tax=Calocera viscosa (strain TUFC12733) TaxID=1330018 RepID=A0A167LE73_CALVF|nr:hypothetical protein CALVIDRAFT_163306 [Calocera viscosa TUFC12733]
MWGWTTTVDCEHGPREEPLGQRGIGRERWVLCKRHLRGLFFIACISSMGILPPSPPAQHCRALLLRDVRPPPAPSPRSHPKRCCQNLMTEAPQPCLAPVQGHHTRQNLGMLLGTRSMWK